MDTLTAPNRAAVFLDRDGTLNEDRGYVYSRDQFVWIPGAVEAIRALNDAGLFVVVVTNQAGVGHGFYSETDVLMLHRFMENEMEPYGARVDAWYYCPFHPEGRVEEYRVDAACRKPRAGMLLDAAKAHALDLSKSWLVGDKVSDIEAGRRAQTRTVLVRTGYGAQHEPTANADHVVDSIVEASELILDAWTTTR